MIIHFNIKNQEIKMWSLNEIKADKLEHKVFDITDLEFEKLKQNWPSKIEDNKLIQKMSSQALSEKETEDKKNLIENTKKAIKDAKDLNDIKKVLESFVI